MLPRGTDHPACTADPNRTPVICQTAGMSMVLTEILSNTAIAALMAPIALEVAAEMGVDPRPFVVGVMFAASAASRADEG